MLTNSNVKNLMKIVIAAAWIDGKIQPEERRYLRQLAQNQGVAHEPELKPLLYELVSVEPEKCYELVKEYLGSNPKIEDCQKLIEAVSGLIYSDGEVAIEEARLLTKLQTLCHETGSMKADFHAIVQYIQKLYRSCVEV